MSRTFAGDYCVSNPCPDECISGIKGTADKYIVQGNVEKYPEKLVGQEPALDRRADRSYTHGRLRPGRKVIADIPLRQIFILLLCLSGIV